MNQMSDPRPSVVVLAGPNGAGKSTAAPALLQGALAVNEFVNADVIARGLSAFDPAAVAIAAGRVMLGRLRELAGQRASFAFETTLASRTFAPCRTVRAPLIRLRCGASTNNPAGALCVQAQGRQCPRA
jgi:predicted ABC-type ATPase